MIHLYEYLKKNVASNITDSSFDQFWKFVSFLPNVLMLFFPTTCLIHIHFLFSFASCLYLLAALKLSLHASFFFQVSLLSLYYYGIVSLSVLSLGWHMFVQIALCYIFNYRVENVENLSKLYFEVITVKDLSLKISLQYRKKVI